MMKNVSEIVNSRKSCSIEDRRNNLQKYLVDLTLIPMIKESDTFRQFIGMDVESPEEYECLASLNVSCLASKENIMNFPDQLSPN